MIIHGMNTLIQLLYFVGVINKFSYKLMDDISTSYSLISNLGKNNACINYFRLAMESEQMRSLIILIDQYKYLHMDVAYAVQLNHAKRNGWKRI